MPPLVRYFSQEEHALAFLERGEVMFRALSYFRDYEDDAGVRADAYEGTLMHLPHEGLRIRRVPSGQELSLPHTLQSTTLEDDIFVYCASTELSDSIAARFQASVAVTITEPERFLASVRSALGIRPRIRAEKLIHQAVRYYELHEPPIVDWALPERIALRKPKHFEWQKEYRFAVPRGNAFAIENVQVKLVPIGAPRPQRALDHPRMPLKLGRLLKVCRLHRF